MNIPKLRFKEFTDEWNIHKLKDLCTTCGGGTPSKSITEYWTGNIPWISSSDLESNSIFKINISKFITTKAISESATKIIPPNSILIVSRVGVGKVAINYNELCTSQDFTNLINIKSNPIFLTYLLKIKMEKQIQQTQGTSIKGITTNDIKNINCTLPNIKEQEKIATFLTTVDKKITNLENTITSLENQKKGLLQQIFSQKLRFKDKNGNNYPNWEKKKLGDIGSFSRGGNLSKSDLSKKGTSCILYGELYTYYNEFATEIKSKTLNTTNLVLSKKYDVLLPLSGETAEDISTCTCIFFDDIALGSDLLIFRSSFFDGRFMSLLLKYKYKYKIAQIAQGKSIVHISEKNIKNINIKIPCIEEQQNIADFILIFTKKLENQKAQLEHWKQIKKGLLQQMFV